MAVSADALQVYEGLPILTGARTRPNRRLEHRLLGFVPIDETFSAGRLRASAPTRRSTRCSRPDRRPIVVGGTGLYLRAALAELDLRPPVDPAIRARWAARPAPARELHAAAAGRRRAGIQPDRPPAHPARATSCSRPATSPRRPRTRRPSCGPRTRAIPTLLAALTMDRDALYARIDARIDAMLEAGVREEVQKARRTRRLRRPRARRSASRSCSTATSRPCGRRPAATPSASSRGCASCPNTHRST